MADIDKFAGNPTVVWVTPTGREQTFPASDNPNLTSNEAGPWVRKDGQPVTPIPVKADAIRPAQDHPLVHPPKPILTDAQIQLARDLHAIGVSRLSDLAELDREYQTKERRLIHLECETFADLVKSVDDYFLGRAKIGRLKATGDTGEQYEEFRVAGLCRSNEFDVRVTKKSVLGQFARQLERYLAEREGPVYWRIRLEEDLIDLPQVIRYASNGPDEDFPTGKRCYLDPDWQCYQIYCRLLRSDKPSLVDKD